MAGHVTPPKKEFPHPFQLADRYLRADFLTEFAYQGFLICFAKGDMAPGKGKAVVIRRLCFIQIPATR